ncbi:hypothetical protein B005_3585 [Nocardiopsis alba ATCC BAA-2165]|uniref:Uncharacterized protein n=1 Tax=Nocardiopsis alba (strain ATCC BAA-2165 / BE74) TaxID=1205910 RepID=J7LJK6_NOCAA|nr:hypothetical protein B005_3585 [Nocardiopsis alba ATCC BAA-2165]
MDIGSIHIPPGGSTRPSSGFFPFAHGRGGGRAGPCRPLCGWGACPRRRP